MEDKNILHMSFGINHVMALDNEGQIYGWGNSKWGCLGFGDYKKRS